MKRVTFETTNGLLSGKFPQPSFHKCSGQILLLLFIFSAHFALANSRVLTLTDLSVSPKLGESGENDPEFGLFQERRRRRGIREADETSAASGPVATVDFLRRYGYLESPSSPDSETLFSSESIQEAIREMQRFASLNVTGEIDAETMKLLSRPRCGLPDKIRNKKRRRRYVIGAQGWNKREVTYSIENWSGKIGAEEVKRKIEKAFSIWAPYAHLGFVPVERSGRRHSDISISFGRGHHGDRYPFDGPGGILAHAFFPYSDSESLGGDIHFDEDENWRSGGSSRGKRESDWNSISFLDVASHEIGHSLGLAHTSDQNAVMFPYYQTRSEDELRLGYDDIMALYQLYIQKRTPEDEEEEDEDRGSSHESGEDAKDESAEQFPEWPKSTTTTTESTPTFTIPNEDPPVEPVPSPERTTKAGPTLSTHSYPGTTPSSSSPPPPPPPDSETLPNLCSDPFDSMAFLRNELFIFSGRFMWRLRDRGSVPEEGYPIRISRLFPGLESVDRMDGAYERESDGRIIFLSGNKYWIFDGTDAEDNSPLPLSDFGLPTDSSEEPFRAFVWGRNRRTYFFRGGEYWKFNETLGEIDEGYPQPISKWGGMPSPIQSVLRWRDGQTYFFKDGSYLRIDDYSVQIEETGRTADFWFNCRNTSESIMP